MSKPTAECRAIADALLAAVHENDVEKVALVISQIHDRAVLCAEVRAERRIDEAAKSKQLSIYGA